jgi:hypothetical protein
MLAEAKRVITDAVGSLVGAELDSVIMARRP